MSENTLVINCGSSSLKFAVFDTSNGECIIKGVAEPLLAESPTLKWSTETGGDKVALPKGADLTTALETIATDLLSDISISSVGHRVVHGAEKFNSSAIINDEMIAQVTACNKLAPLHNPANLLGISIAKKVFGDIPHVGVFDTAFHQSIKKEVFMYPIPYEFYTELGIRKYGFHGTSHHYVFKQAALRMNKPESETAIISAHLGNGCSATATQGGKSKDTTMGLTPLEGLMMGTRSGDIDPSLHGFLCKEKGLSFEEVDNILNKKSGLLGVSGLSNDMRVIQQGVVDGNERAQLALDMFNFRIAKSLSALRVSLDYCDAIIFTGGVGEHNPDIRKDILERLSFLGIEVDDAANEANGKDTDGLISKPSSQVAAYVIPTNEELMIAQETAATIAQG